MYEHIGLKNLLQTKNFLRSFYQKTTHNSSAERSSCFSVGASFNAFSSAIKDSRAVIKASRSSCIWEVKGEGSVSSWVNAWRFYIRFLLKKHLGGLTLYEFELLVKSWETEMCPSDFIRVHQFLPKESWSRKQNWSNLIKFRSSWTICPHLLKFLGHQCFHHRWGLAIHLWGRPSLLKTAWGNAKKRWVLRRKPQKMEGFIIRP